MGLCKCRTVTTLFCFEHRKNVCERCVVGEHPTCVVKTYLQWLQDSEFDPNCPLCKEPFTAATGKATIRLPCFDLFHWECLEAELGRSGEQALARAKCPLCRVSILPGGASPLALQIRSVLSATRWSAQLPPLKEPSAAERDPLKSNPSPPASQPNGVEMVAIDIGSRPSFLEAPSRTRRPDEPKLHGHPRTRRVASTDDLRRLPLRHRLASLLRVLLNCVTLRNVRMCSLGISPRQTLIILVVVFATFFVGFKFLVPFMQPIA